KPMNRSLMRWVALTLAVAGAGSRPAAAQATKATEATKYDKPQGYTLTADERKTLEDRTAEIERLLAPFPRTPPRHPQALADVAVYAKAGTWAVRFDEFYTKKDVAMTLGVLDRGVERARALAAGKRPWASARGESIRGYESKVDGSFQPYSVIVPEGIDP